MFTTFARLGEATEHIPTDRVIDGIDQTSLLMNGDTFSRRDYVFVYTGPILAATIKSRYKRVLDRGADPGLTGAAFVDLYTDPREANGKMLPMFPAKGMFNMMKSRHELWIKKYPNSPGAARVAADGHRKRPSRDRGRRQAAGRLRQAAV